MSKYTPAERSKHVRSAAKGLTTTAISLAAMLNPSMPLYANLTAGGQYPGLDLPTFCFLYRSSIWSDGQDTMTLPDRDGYIAMVRALSNTETIILDVEQWPMDVRTSSEADVLASVDMFVTLIGWTRIAVPSARIGIYGELPIRKYFDAISDPDSDRYKGWQDANDLLAPLASAADILCPSIYTFYENHELEVVYTQAMVAEARRVVGDLNTLIMPTYWPRYHHGNTKQPELHGTGIPGDYWRLKLETADDLNVDGLIIWDVPRLSTGEVWTEQTLWIQATKKYTEAA